MNRTSSASLLAALGILFAVSAPAAARYEVESPGIRTEQSLALIDVCAGAMPRAHPWRARQLRSAMLRLRLSMAYHTVETRLSPADRRAAAATERESYFLLADTCRPLLL